MEGCRKKTLQLGIDKKEDDSGLVVVEPLLQLILKVTQSSYYMVDYQSWK
jgi:hypothetical protein